MRIAHTSTPSSIGTRFWVVACRYVWYGGGSDPVCPRPRSAKFWFIMVYYKLRKHFSCPRFGGAPHASPEDTFHKPYHILSAVRTIPDSLQVPTIHSTHKPQSYFPFSVSHWFYRAMPSGTVCRCLLHHFGRHSYWTLVGLETLDGFDIVHLTPS